MLADIIISYQVLSAKYKALKVLYINYSNPYIITM